MTRTTAGFILLFAALILGTLAGVATYELTGSLVADFLVAFAVSFVLSMKAWPMIFGL